MSESVENVKEDPSDDGHDEDQQEEITTHEPNPDNDQQEDDGPTPSSSSWSETDDTALMLFVQDAIKGQQITTTTDPLEDTNEHLWSEISERFPGKTAINCLQRYAKIKLRELQNMRSDMITDSVSSSVGSGGNRRAAEDERISPDTKRARMNEDDLLFWSEDEVNILRTAVSQYVNSECLFCVFGQNVVFSGHFFF
jgi:hypothetical protein